MRILLALLPMALANLHDESLRYCESYSECVAVSRLEERLCIGNSRQRPYWLPSFHDPLKCHDKLKNDYKMLDHLEVQIEKKYTSCLIEQTVPLTEEEANGHRCSYQILQDAPRFSFARTISYVPTNCFTGLERRIEKACGRLRDCCQATKRCRYLLTESDEAGRVNVTRAELYKRAKGCERGEVIEPLALSPEIASQNDEDLSWSPKGNITFRVRDEQTVRKEEEEAAAKAKQAREQQDQANSQGTIRINIHEERKWNSDNRAHPPRFSERIGQLSRPFNLNRGHVNKVIFERGTKSNRRRNIILKKDQGDLTIEVEHSADDKPTLTFPKEAEPETKKEIQRLPLTIEQHNAMFDEALKNDRALRKKIEEQEKRAENTEMKVVATIDSLLDASAAAAKMLDGPSTQSPQDLQSIDEDVPTVSGKIVTSAPLILVKSTPSATTKGCKQHQLRVFPPKTTSAMLNFDRIMKEMGEDSDEESMKALRDVLDNFKTDVRGKLVQAREHTDDKKVIQVLDELIANFDKAQKQLHSDRAFVNATFAPSDYPEDDAQIADSECEPLPEAEEQPLPKDEHNDPIVLQNGDEKLVIDNGNLALEGKPDTVSKSDEVAADQYKKELEEFKRIHHIDTTIAPERNETACDLYMRCKNQMHLALDGCAWRFAASRVLPTLAESAESLLYRGDELCNPAERPLYEQLYDLVMARNTRLKKCLTRVNEQFFANSVCLPFSVEVGMGYNSALLRVLSANYTSSSQCFHDANLIQEKCTKLRECCPNFDRCRDDTLDITEEQAIISQTAKVNERKQECLRVKAKEQFQLTLRELLGKGGPDVLKKIRNKQFLHPVRRA